MSDLRRLFHRHRMLREFHMWSLHRPSVKVRECVCGMVKVGKSRRWIRW